MGQRSLWALCLVGEGSGLGLRLAYSPEGDLTVETVHADAVDRYTLELGSPSGSLRVLIQMPEASRPLRATTRFLASHKTAIPFWPRDLYPFDADRDPGSTEGTIHTAQRGLRTGLLYASSSDPDISLLYWQNFSELTKYFELTRTSPADTVGGSWPELGFALPPTVADPVPFTREVTIADTFLTVRPHPPKNEQALSERFLDMVAETYRALPPPPKPTYHDWVAKASETVRDLEHAPGCTYERQGHRYLTPYVGDTGKPPESMVQLSVLLPMLEYEEWAGLHLPLAGELVASVPTFFDIELGSMVRWLAGEPFNNQAEEHQNEDQIDSWYLYHTLFNLSRLGRRHRPSLSLLKQSLPFAIRVARRFEYRWPVFFDLRTLDIVREEAEPAAGGETDVAGLYALVMLQAHELLGGKEFLDEAIRASDGLSGLLFNMTYQTNTLGFATQAMLELWRLTGERRYMNYADMAIANLLDNAWLWFGSHGHARHYTTFFGIFPLREAPYVAAYEEVELMTIFHRCLEIAGDRLRPSARFLLAEYVRYALDRAWFYYPSSLPSDLLSSDVRNGDIERSLAVPIEDLQDAWQQSGQVGQEVYGSGISLAFASRHFRKLREDLFLFCDYPLLEERLSHQRRRHTLALTTAGQRKGRCSIRIIPAGPAPPAGRLVVKAKRGGGWRELKPETSEEGHLIFPCTGASRYSVSW